MVFSFPTGYKWKKYTITLKNCEVHWYSVCQIRLCYVIPVNPDLSSSVILMNLYRTEHTGMSSKNTFKCGERRKWRCWLMKYINIILVFAIGSDVYKLLT